jgi:hypothetical protein
LRSTLRRLYSFPPALDSGFIMMTPPQATRRSRLRVVPERGAWTTVRAVLTAALRSPRHCTPKGHATDDPSLTSLSPCPLSPRWRPATPSGCLPFPHWAFAPSERKDITLRWVIRGWTGILLICHARMRGVLVWPRGCEAFAFSPFSPPLFLPRSVLVVSCVCLLLAVCCFPFPVVLLVRFRSVVLCGRPPLAVRTDALRYGWLKRITETRIGLASAAVTTAGLTPAVAACAVVRAVCQLVAGGGFASCGCWRSCAVPAGCWRCLLAGWLGAGWLVIVGSRTLPPAPLSRRREQESRRNGKSSRAGRLSAPETQSGARGRSWTSGTGAEASRRGSERESHVLLCHCAGIGPQWSHAGLHWYGGRISCCISWGGSNRMPAGL